MSEPLIPLPVLPPVNHSQLAGICYPGRSEAALKFFRTWFELENAAPWPEGVPSQTPPALESKASPTDSRSEHQANPDEADPELEAGTAEQLVRSKAIFEETVALLPNPEAPERFLGVVTPHIDFRVSPASYTHAFAPWLTMPPPDTVVVLGVGHRFTGAGNLDWSLDPRDFESPFGRIENDRETVERLNEASRADLLGDPVAHHGEHSIEFPLVLLQALNHLREVDTPFRFVPLLCGGLVEHVYLDQPVTSDCTLERLGRALRNWIDDETKAGRRVQIITSIDGCHIGPRFDHDFAVDDHLLELAEAWEENLWQLVEQRDRDGFIDLLRRDGNARHFDGTGALALLLTAFPEALQLQRSYYEQWYEESDRSAVTFTSGWMGVGESADR